MSGSSSSSSSCYPASFTSEDFESSALGNTDSECPPAKKKAKTVTQSSSHAKFKPSWKLPLYITSSSKGNKYAYCKLCSSHFTVSHGGFNDLKRHVDGAGHQQRLKDSQKNASISTFFGEAREPSLAHASKVMSAELMMTQFIAMHNLPFQAADHLSDLFSSMFPDSKIAADFACKHTKTKAVICDALDPHLKKPVIDLVKTSPFNLLCDESNERGDAVKLLTILVRVFEPNNGIIVTRHLETVGITDLTADGIFTALEETLQKYQLPFSHVMSFTSDTCNVMKGARGGVIAKLRVEQPKIIDIYCVCHLVNLCVKAATKTLPLKVDDLLVDIYYHFRNSVKRMASLHDYAEFCSIEYKSVLNHCETRWLSLRRAIQRTLEMWEPLCSYFCSHPDVEKPGKVRTIFRLLSDPLTKPWLCFLSNTLAVFDKFNVFFQTSSTATIHKLHGESERLLKTVLSFFIDPCVLRLNSSDLTKVNYTDPSIHLPEEELFIGDDTAAFILHLRDNEGESVEGFYKGVVKFYEGFVKKQLKAFDFKSQIFHMLSFLDPIQSQNIPQSTFDLIEDNIPVVFNKAVTKFEHREFVTDTDIDPEVDCDAVKFWLKVCSMKSPMGELKYENLATLALQLLSIPASNADSERVFSLVRRIKTEFRSSLSTETVSALIGCHFNKTSKCCEMTKFADCLLVKAKTCTHERNMSYTST